MTARSHETIRVGLRRIIRDNNVGPKVRMDAIELLMKVEGLLDAEMPKKQPKIARNSDANSKRFEELLELAEENKRD